MQGHGKVLEFLSVSKNYGSVRALNNISVSVAPGEIVALLGCNGAGKSSFVNIAAGLLRPSEGDVKVFGELPSSQSAKIRRRILPQELGFPKNLTVREILSLVFAHYQTGVPLEAAEEIGLTSLFSRMTTELSGGERRKLAFLCALAGEPSLVLLDEPTANIDLIGQESIRKVIKRYFKDGSRALIFSSHYMNEVEILADRVVVLNAGEIVFDGPVGEIKGLLGEKKVRFRPSRMSPQFKVPSASRVIESNEFVELHGASSDELLKDVLRQDPNATHFQIDLPTLEESILKIWDSRRKSQHE